MTCRDGSPGLAITPARRPSAHRLAHSLAGTVRDLANRTHNPAHALPHARPPKRTASGRHAVCGSVGAAGCSRRGSRRCPSSASCCPRRTAPTGLLHDLVAVPPRHPPCCLLRCPLVPRLLVLTGPARRAEVRRSQQEPATTGSLTTCARSTPGGSPRFTAALGAVRAALRADALSARRTEATCRTWPLRGGPVTFHPALGSPQIGRGVTVGRNAERPSPPAG